MFNIFMVFAWYFVSPFVSGLSALLILALPCMRVRLGGVPRLKFLLAWAACAAVAGCIYRNLFGVATGLLFDLFIILALYAWAVMTEKLAMKIITLSAALSILVFILAAAEVLLLHEKRASATFYNPNYYGYVCELTIVLCLYGFYRISSRRWFFVAAAAANAGGIALSGCRSAFFAVLAGGMVLLLCLKRYKPFIFLTSLTAICGAAVLVFPQLIPRAGDMGRTAWLRMLIWRTALEGFRQRPLFGGGFLAYAFFSTGEAHRNHAHNLLLDALVSYGLVGTALAMLFLVPAVISWVKSLKRSPVCALPLGLLAATLTHGVTDVPVVGYQTGTLIMVLLAISGAARYETGRKEGAAGIKAAFRRTQ